VSLLKSEQFQRDVAKATTKVRNDAIQYRQLIGRTTGVSALTKFIRGS
jgi:hypothetical protein